MGVRGLCAALAVALLNLAGLAPAGAQSPTERIDAALQNITSIVRADRVGYATIWDGNKYVQCRRLPNRDMRCEAAGVTLQPSLARVLNAERQSRLVALAWVLDPAFGNYTRTFPGDMPTSQIAEHVLKALTEAYLINIPDLEFGTAWVVDIPCPPRNGPSQNLAGMINDAKSMLPTALLSCSYKAPAAPQRAETLDALLALYGPSTTAEIQRLRINATQRVHVVFDSGIGYIQCMPEMPPVALYCEAQSAERWPALTAVLTPDKIARLTTAGYAEPGRAPNYSKSYPLTLADGAIATEILTLLHSVYGYTGSTRLKIRTE
ncbi:hypothetical protein [Rhodopseudomonas telluris]|uniref:Uncharacterized protein n=1 Tax=Rhodopseudomonas telluris TaxID=644215 RepID=A0ABV6EWE0_9BRAD